jgi:maltose O-acetyltransferase
MTEEERIFTGRLYETNVPELMQIKQKAHNLSREFNKLSDEDTEERQRILHELLLEIGEGTAALGPIWFHYGCHTKIGAHCYLNFNFTVQDDAMVTIGDYTRFGPNATIVTPLHPMRADERRSMVCNDGETRYLIYARPVKIGHDCWFGANVTVCPGVTIGDNCVIGAGSVVTRDIPSDSFAAGVPAKVIRTITKDESVRDLLDY